MKLSVAQRRLLGDAVGRGKIVAYGSARKSIDVLEKRGLVEVSRWDGDMSEYRATPAGVAAFKETEA